MQLILQDILSRAGTTIRFPLETGQDLTGWRVTLRVLPSRQSEPIVVVSEVIQTPTYAILLTDEMTAALGAQAIDGRYEVGLEDTEGNVYVSEQKRLYLGKTLNASSLLPTSPSDASAINFNNTQSQMAAQNVQAALDELDADLDSLEETVGTIQQSPGPQGEPGPAGPAGAVGKSAYEEWLDQGGTGTEEEFLASLKGADAPLDHRHDWSDLDNMPDTFVPAQHNHKIGDITNLQTVLGAKADLLGGKVPAEQIPSAAITEYLGQVASEAEMLALIGQVGDWCERTDLGQSYILITDDPTLPGNWKEIVAPGKVTSVNDKTGTVVLTADDLPYDNNQSHLISITVKTAVDELDTKVTGKAEADHDHDDATMTSSGFMSASDKTKLAAVGTNANRNAYISASDPQASDGSDGDIWYKV